MNVEKFDIAGPTLFTPAPHQDTRGFFMESYRESWLEEVQIDIQFRQENHARSTQKGVIRGLHFQYGQMPQAKLIRVIKGSIFDVAVDIRHGSPTFGKHIGVELSADNFRQLLVPHGFAHGYCTLTDDTEVIYKVDNYYAPELEAGILWNDPDLAINWPIENETAILSPKDQELLTLSKSPIYYRYSPEHSPFQAIALKDGITK